MIQTRRDPLLDLAPLFRSAVVGKIPDEQGQDGFDGVAHIYWSYATTQSHTTR
jgi:hypothetical protein